jgi:zinc protease
MDALGLLFDRDMVAFYGDPAWEARLAPQTLAFTQSLKIIDNHLYEFTILPQRGTDSFAPINTNGSQRGGRPFIAFLPHRITNPNIIQGTEHHPVITDNFILIPNPLTCDPEKHYTVRFTADIL